MLRQLHPCLFSTTGEEKQPLDKREERSSSSIEHPSCASQRLHPFQTNITRVQLQQNNINRPNNINMTLPQSFASSTTITSDTRPINSSQPSETARPPLPQPQIFDILPTLHELLSRIERAPPSTSSQLPDHDSTNTNNNEIGAHYQDQAPLEPKELPTEVLAIKAKIRKALREVERLPDMEWSVEEQEEEITELEERIERQKEVVGRLGSMGREVGLG